MSDVRTYTEEQVTKAANAAADIILEEIELDQDGEDLLHLLVNAAVTVLVTDMQADFSDVIAENYGLTVDEFKSERGF
ncbi:hypothetical protein GPA10_22470 [Streptomyces sp. p1417]|uniref:Uncharacterized protein n=1 Tax=Streptomyces typhae TaxID=2681492 RepID=A0A6L6X107_9ACTN|nr:hypothetical protein [Streptomyces typhae]MVO87451.1 hypothetical protein [Streptomyces typhae]